MITYATIMTNDTISAVLACILIGVLVISVTIMGIGVFSYKVNSEQCIKNGFIILIGGIFVLLIVGFILSNNTKFEKEARAEQISQSLTDTTGFSIDKNILYEFLDSNDSSKDIVVFNNGVAKQLILVKQDGQIGVFEEKDGTLTLIDKTL